MAKENFVLLMGQLRNEPRFATDPVSGVESALFQLWVVRRNPNDEAGNISPKWDKPLISTTEPSLVRKIKEFKLHDIIEIEGIFRTQNAMRRKICPECNAAVLIPTPVSTIYPTYIDMVTHLSNDTEGFQYLYTRAEHSNHAKVIGRVCTPTDKILHGETDHGDLYARYQLAVNRKLFVKDSIDEEDHTDYPFVYSYGDVADKDLTILKQGTLIYLDGYLHTMVFEDEAECSECHNIFPFKYQRMNLTPYSTEYLRDYDELTPSTHSDISKVDEGMEPNQE